MTETTALTERQQAILGLVVREYVRTAQPVSSRRIIQLYGLGVSTATVRNEMAYLEQRGYLTHPHTSAGRVPTEAGYRYFVTHLMQTSELPAQEMVTVSHQFQQARGDVDQWLAISTTALARLVAAAALATMPRPQQSRFKHLELIVVRDATILLVLVLQEGLVKQQLLTLDQPVTQQEMSNIVAELNRRFIGLDSEQIGQALQAMSPLLAQISGIVVQVMRRADGRISERLYRDGLANILSQPEFAGGEQAHQVVAIFEQWTPLAVVMEEASRSEGVQVIIGGEGRWPFLNGVSMVVSRYGNVEGMSGAVGILGPTRMQYGTAISAVRYVSGLLSELMQRWYESRLES